MSDELDDLVNELTEQPTLTKTLGSMADDHFAQVVHAVENELVKRRPPDLANMSEGQFNAYVNAVTK